MVPYNSIGKWLRNELSANHVHLSRSRDKSCVSKKRFIPYSSVSCANLFGSQPNKFASTSLPRDSSMDDVDQIIKNTYMK